MNKIRLVLIGATLALGVQAYEAVSSVNLHGATLPETICSTDSECMEFCPADDVECDGGPQS